MISDIEIKTINNGKRQNAEFYIDGKQVHGVRRFNISQDADDYIPMLTLEIIGVNLTIDGVRLWNLDKKEV